MLPQGWKRRILVVPSGQPDQPFLGGNIARNRQGFSCCDSDWYRRSMPAQPYALAVGAIRQGSVPGYHHGATAAIHELNGLAG